MPDRATPHPIQPAAQPLSLRWRRGVGFAIWGCGALAAIEWLWREVIAGQTTVELALWAGCIAALATALGTLPALLSVGTGERARDAMLGFGAGVMLAASAFSLIVPALAAAQHQGAGRLAASLWVGASILIGALLLLGLERGVAQRLDQSHQRATAEGRSRASVWFFVLAVMLHNLPEGLAIGVGFAGESLQAGRALATGIAIQDVPEGLVIAMALRGIGQSRTTAVLVGALSGLCEPVMAVLGALMVGTSTLLLVPGLGIAAGAMLFVIGHSVIPEAHRGGRPGLAAGGLMFGFVLMMVLDTALG